MSREDEIVFVIGELFCGTMLQWEDNFGGLDGSTYDEKMDYIVEWAREVYSAEVTRL